MNTIWSIMHDTPRLPELAAFQQPLWTPFEKAIAEKRPAQALLLAGPLHTNPAAFATRLIAAFLCNRENAPCNTCVSCQQMAVDEHPGVVYVQPEAGTSGIKVDRIRALQEEIVNTPHAGMHRFVRIMPADAMNTAASNALLKILEEPPSHTVFVLVATQISTLAPTILSRCEKWSMPLPEFAGEAPNPFCFLEPQFYPKESLERTLLEGLPTHLEALTAVFSGVKNPVALAQAWSKTPLDGWLWLLQGLMLMLLRHHVSGEPLEPSFKALAMTLTPHRLLQLLDGINRIKKSMRRGVIPNTAVALESIFCMGMTP
ncbi:hypothetical protein [Legionella geestiana]|nr:hypothetical protein [Legionella geestiana]